MGFVERKLTVPSMGFLNSEFGSSEFTIREMTVADYKNLSAPGNWMDKLISLVKSCLVSPSSKEIQVESLAFADLTYIIMCIRAISLSTEEAYTMGISCISCQASFNKTIQVPSDLKVKYLKEKIEEPIKTKLSNGDIIGWNMARVSDVVDFSRKQKNDKDAVFRLAVANRIKEINGKPVASIEIDEYFNNLPIRYFEALEKDMADKDFGIDLEFEAVCPECGISNKYMLRLDPSFFRANVQR